MPRDAHIELVLIRAGATEWDDAGRLQGRTDLPLSEAAAAAFEAEAATLPATVPAPAVVYTAPDDASTQSARFVAGAFEPAVKVKPITGLAAVSLGLWQGLLPTELETRHPRKYKTWCEDPAAITPHEGEPLLDAEARILAALARLADKAASSPLTVVLRPFEMALVIALLDHDEPVRLREAAERLPAAVRRTIHRGAFKSLLGTAKAVA